MQHISAQHPGRNPHIRDLLIANNNRYSKSIISHPHSNISEPESRQTKLNFKMRSVYKRTNSPTTLLFDRATKTVKTARSKINNNSKLDKHVHKHVSKNVLHCFDVNDNDNNTKISVFWKLEMTWYNENVRNNTKDMKSKRITCDIFYEDDYIASLKDLENEKWRIVDQDDSSIEPIFPLEKFNIQLWMI